MRLQSFEALATDDWYGRLFAKLTVGDLIFCRSFIRQYDGCDFSQFAEKLRWSALKNPVMDELLMVANQRAHR